MTTTSEKYSDVLATTLVDLYAGIKVKAASVIKECKRYVAHVSKFKVISLKEYISKQLNYSALIGTVAHMLVSNIPSIKKADDLRTQDACNYYKKTGGAVTMC